MPSLDHLELCAATEPDLEPLADVLSHSFAFPTGDAKPWFARAGLENIRTLKRAGQIRGGLLEIPMGQWFGGRSVSTMGVAGVGIVPEERGRGVGLWLMTAMLREARARGFALSTLYPNTVTLYRRVGYERAGSRFSISFDPRMCDVPRVPEMTIAEVALAPAEVVAVYKATAQTSPGFLDRGPYIWSRTVQPTGRVTKTFTASHGNTVEGYVVLAHVSSGDGSTVQVTDLAATTARAARAILRMLVEYRSMATLVRWHGGASDLFTNVLPERHFQMSLTDNFMVRIVDVAKALEQRGWPRLAEGSLVFDLSDASMPENNGQYTLTVNNGRGTVARGPSDAARVKITEHGLAALYTGHMSPELLGVLGLLDPEKDARGLLEDWFRGPQPSTRDYF